MGRKFDNINAQTAKNNSEKMWSRGASFNEILDYLRDLGFSQGISVFILQRATSVPHHEAKQAVLLSNAWSEVREENLNIQKAIDDFLDQEENGEEQYDH